MPPYRSRITANPGSARGFGTFLTLTRPLSMCTARIRSDDNTRAQYTKDADVSTTPPPRSLRRGITAAHSIGGNPGIPHHRRLPPIRRLLHDADHHHHRRL